MKRNAMEIIYNSIPYLKILIGYNIIMLYSFILIMVLGSSLAKKYEVEFSRKIIHILLCVMWVVIYYFFRDTVHQVILPFVFLVINTLSYRYRFLHAIERNTYNHLGTIYFAIAIIIIMLFSFFKKEMFPFTGFAVACLTFGDGFAGLFGYYYGRNKIYRNKSFVGSLSCFVFAFIGCAIIKLLFIQEFQWYEIFILSLVTVVAELADWGLDNITITLSSFFVGYIIHSFFSWRLFIAFTLSLLLFWAVFLSRSIDYLGAITSGIVVFCFFYFGGISITAFLFICYGVIVIISLIKKKYISDVQVESLQDGINGKNATQIFANGFMGTIFIVLNGIFDDKRFMLISCISIAGCFIDSISSDVGGFSPRLPYDFIKHKNVSNGISGGVTFLGNMASIIATFVVSFGIRAICRISLYLTILSFLIILSQTFIDTILGSVFQAKYICQHCGTITEKKVHCNDKTIFNSGLRIINNNAVNIISSLLTGLLACAVFLH